MSEDSERAVLFVFYQVVNTVDPKKTRWPHRVIPGDWEWIGSGGTPNPSYPYEEQLMGSPEDAEKVKKYLTGYYTRLVEKGVVKRFKIRNSYKP